MGKREKKKIKGTSIRPRLIIFRSHKHIYAQIIDDSCSRTLLSCSTVEKEIKLQLGSTSNIVASNIVGQTIGKRLLSKNINSIVFDRNGRPFHGRIKALAQGARDSGIIF
jgi:large subunit ribosomal protein L18